MEGERKTNGRNTSRLRLAVYMTSGDQYFKNGSGRNSKVVNEQRYFAYSETKNSATLGRPFEDYSSFNNYT